MSVSTKQIVTVLGGQRGLGRHVRTMRDLDSIVREGMGAK